jgi:hypothetical protein
MHNLYTAAGAVFYHKVVAPEGAKGGVENPDRQSTGTQSELPKAMMLRPKGLFNACLCGNRKER